jgi:hypothetical protein
MSSEARQSGGKVAFTERYIPRDHGRVYSRDYEGAGPTFVLMHGFPDNLRIYDDIIPPRCKAVAGSLHSISWASAPRTSRQGLPKNRSLFPSRASLTRFGFIGSSASMMSWKRTVRLSERSARVFGCLST